MICGKFVAASEASKLLLKYTRKNNVKLVQKLIKKHPELLDYEYTRPNENIHNQTILIIACNDNNISSTTLYGLIEMGASCTHLSKNDHWEAIHYAAIHANKEKLKIILDKLTVEEANSLVYCSTHVPKKFLYHPEKQQEKSYSNNALHLLLKYGNRNSEFQECCRLLICKGVSFYQTDSNGVAPIDILKENEMSEVLKFCNEIKHEVKKDIFFLISDTENFIKRMYNQEEVNTMDGPTENLSSCTLLQLCCAKGLTSCVKHILDCDANPNKIIQKNQNYPVMIAIKQDYEEIVKLLLQSNKLVLPEDILIKIQTKYKYMKSFSRIDKYLELVLDFLLKKDKAKVRKYFLSTDELERTALHYAVQYRSPQNILKLLSLGAPLTKKDIFGHTPLHSIDSLVLEKFFDNCIDLPKDNEQIDDMLFALKTTKEKFSIEINYEALASGCDDGNVHESEFLYRLTKIKKLTHLMNHPVILSYVNVKWTKFKWAVYGNLLLYFVAYVSLFFYGFAFNLHPNISNIFLLTSLVIILLRENIQLMIFRMDYIKRVDNIVDLFLIAGIIYIVVSGWLETLLNSNLKVAYSVVFLTSTLGIFLQLGNLPFFTVKVIILRQITISFCKHMIFYAFPVLAFFFCFYMLQETEDDNSFFQTLYDVTTMFAGDPDASYPQQFSTNPIFSHIIYVCFILLIGIILQNLLIGLAVSDLQEIQKEAEFIDKTERASYITNLERIIFTKLKQSTYIFSTNMFRKLLKICEVFQREKILVVQPYNYGCVYVKDNEANKNYIKDLDVINSLQNILKDLTFKKTCPVTEEPYSLKSISESLQKIENFLQQLDVNHLLRK